MISESPVGVEPDYRAGTGVFVIGDREVTIAPCQTFVTPPEIHHTVSAGCEDLLLPAIFAPALVLMGSLRIYSRNGRFQAIIPPVR
jgi:hypothetical protein